MIDGQFLLQNKVKISLMGYIDLNQHFAGTPGSKCYIYSEENDQNVQEISFRNWNLQNFTNLAILAEFKQT